MNHTAEIFDATILDTLRQVMEREYPVLLRVFINDTREHLLGLRQAVLEEDVQAAARLSHSLKGSCQNMGALQLVALSTQVETLARAGVLPDGATLAALQDAAGRAETVVQQQLDVHPA